MEVSLVSNTFFLINSVNMKGDWRLLETPFEIFGHGQRDIDSGLLNVFVNTGSEFIREREDRENDI